MEARSPTPIEQQYLETIYNDGKQIRVDKRFDGVGLERFDVDLSNDFRQAFPGSTQFKKKSASPTNVFKTTLSGKPYYVKSFKIPAKQQLRFNQEDDRGALLYEKEVYRYIRSKAVRDKEVRKHFAQMILSARDPKNRTAYIFTEDTGGIPLYLLMEGSRSLLKYFQDKEHSITADFVANIFTQLLYVVSLMERIGIVHNDLHFGNVLVVRDGVPTKEYMIYGQLFTLRDHPYSVVVYDFDMASIVGTTPNERNPFRKGLCEEYGRCKDYQSTDKYVWLVHLLRSPQNWRFSNTDEKARYKFLVDKFKENIGSESADGFWLIRWLFGPKKTPQLGAVRKIEYKYNLHDRMTTYPPPLFHASCEYNIATDGCSFMYPPISGSILSNAWKKAITPKKQARMMRRAAV